jgi:glutaredoxin 3
MAIEIYSKNNCSFCEQAKQLLRIHKKDFIEYKLDEDFTREILLTKFPEAKSYPIIVIDGFNIGGFHQLQEHITNMNSSDTCKILLETDSYYGA